METSSFIIGIRFKDTKNDIILDKSDTKNIISLQNMAYLKESQRKTYHSKKGNSHDNLIRYKNDTYECCDEYMIYSKIEQHMNISRILYFLNNQGKEIIEELAIKKFKLSVFVLNKQIGKQKHNDKNEVLKLLYQNIYDIVNFNRLCPNLYTELLNLLDETLFEVNKTIEFFYVHDDVYSLESMYYRQDTWINRIEWKTVQEFIFSESNALDLGECSHIALFISTYQNVINIIKFELASSIKLKALLDIFEKKLNRAENIIKSMLNMLLSE
jgi:hypothetical protein